MEGRTTGNEKGRKVLVKLNAEAAKALDSIREKILSLICDNEKCRETYSTAVTRVGVLRALIEMVLYADDECIIVELARRVAIRDEYTYNRITPLVMQCKERAAGREVVEEGDTKYQAATVQCTDLQRCLEETETSAGELRKLLGSEE
jgi:hypothetical protein